MSLMEEVLSVLDAANCDDHKTEVVADDVAEAFAAAQWCYCWKPESGNPPSYICGSYCDTQGVAVARLKDGAVVVITESSDTSGHG